MDPLQFSLFFAALLIGFVLVHVRLVRAEEHLRQLGNLRPIDERLQAVVAALERMRPERVENLLQRLHEDLEDLRETTGGVREAVVNIPPPPRQVERVEYVPPPPPPVVEPPAGEAVRATVETRLLQLGYGNLRLLSDLRAVAQVGDAEVQFEAEMQHMPCKGRVLLRNGAIRDVAVQAATTLFP